MKKSDFKFYLGLLVIVLLWLFAIKQAPAVEMVIGVGQTQFTPSDAGIWWQRGLPHHIESESKSMELGFTDKFTDSIRWNASYLYLGGVNIWSIDTTDEDYSGNGCRANPCVQNNIFITRSSVEGFKFTSSYEWGIGNNVKYFVEGGVYAFIARFNVTVISSDGTTAIKGIDLNREELWAIKPMIGTGLEWKKWQLALTGYAIDPWKERGENVPNFTGYAYNLSIRKIFE